MLLLEAGYRVRAAVRNVAGFEKIKGLKSAAPYESQIEHILVPDITIPGAYDDAVKGVKYIVHLASPFASPDLAQGDYESSYIQPAVKGSVGMLDSAITTTSVRRIVITGSILSILGLGVHGSDIIVNGTYSTCIEDFANVFVIKLQKLTAVPSLSDLIPTGCRHMPLPKP